MTALVVYQDPLATKAGQIAHYRAVRQRLQGRAMAVARKAAAMAAPVPVPAVEPPSPPPPVIPKVPKLDGCPLLADIKAAVCEICEVTPLELESPRRWMPVSQARQVMMFIARHYTKASYPEIGRRLGGKDHSTVCHGVNLVAANRRRFEARVMAVVAKLGLDPAVLERWGAE